MRDFTREPWAPGVQQRVEGTEVFFAAQGRRGTSGPQAIRSFVVGLGVAAGGLALGYANGGLDLLQGRDVPVLITPLVISVILVAFGALLLAWPVVELAGPARTFVGTRDALVYGRRSRVHTMRWVDVQTTKLVEGGRSVMLMPFPSGRMARPVVIPEVTEPDALLALIHERIAQPRGGAPTARAVPLPVDASERLRAAIGAESVEGTLRATHRPPSERGNVAFGLIFAAFGLLPILFFVPGVGVGAEDGTSTEDAALPWFLVGGSLLFIGVGLGIAWLGLPRRGDVRYAITATRLIVDDGRRVHEHEWRAFTGEVKRRETRRGTTFVLPKRTFTTGRNRVREELGMVGVEDADAAEAALRTRLAES